MLLPKQTPFIFTLLPTPFTPSMFSSIHSSATSLSLPLSLNQHSISKRNLLCSLPPTPNIPAPCHHSDTATNQPPFSKATRMTNYCWAWQPCAWTRKKGMWKVISHPLHKYSCERKGWGNIEQRELQPTSTWPGGAWNPQHYYPVLCQHQILGIKTWGSRMNHSAPPRPQAAN